MSRKIVFFRHDPRNRDSGWKKQTERAPLKHAICKDSFTRYAWGGRKNLKNKTERLKHFI